MSEVWKIIEDFPEYKVSSHGRVKRFIKDQQGKKCGKPLRQWIPNSGYLMVMLYRDGKAKHCLVHRLVCMAFRGKPPTPKHHASHKDGIRTNNKKGNIRWRTASENNMERHKHGTMLTGDNHPTRYMPSCVPRGSRHGNAKLHESDIPKIRNDKRSASVVGKEYGVNLSLICLIRKRKAWKHVP